MTIQIALTLNENEGAMAFIVENQVVDDAILADNESTRLAALWLAHGQHATSAAVAFDTLTIRPVLDFADPEATSSGLLTRQPGTNSTSPLVISPPFSQLTLT